MLFAFVAETKKLFHWVIPKNICRTPLPVVVFFTGGAWLIGTAEWYPAMNLALEGQVIVVSVNYRHVSPKTMFF